LWDEAARKRLALARCRLDEEKQKSSTSLPNATSNVSSEAASLNEELQQKQHVISVLQTEVEALNMQLQQQTSAEQQKQAEWERTLDAAHGKLRATEFERDDMHKQCNWNLREVEALKEDKLRLEVCLVQCHS
jgi:chromosome segregation ATPase